MRAQDLRDDPFAAVLGHGRGAAPIDTVISAAPTDAARADYDEYRAQLRAGDLSGTLWLLNEHRKLLSSRPLLGKLANELCRTLVAQSAQGLEQAARDFLTDSSLDPATSGHLVLVTVQRQVNTSTVKEQTLHVWPEGSRFGPLGCLGSYETATACGLQVEKSWLRARRGSWSQTETVNADGEVEPVPWTHCEDCEKRAGKELAHVLAEPSPYLPFEAGLYKKLLGHVTTKTFEYLQNNGFRDEGALGRVASQTYQRGLLPASLALAVGRREATVQWVLGARTWSMLRRGHGEPLHPLMDKADWETLIAPLVPQLDEDSGRVTMADEATLKALSDQVAALLSERSGVAL